MPGVSWQVNNKVRLFAQFGLNGPQHMSYLYTQGFVSLNKYITVSAGHSFFQSNGINSFQEHDLIAAVTFSKSFGKLTFEDRNMVRMNMIDKSAAAYTYRNRIRVLYPFSVISHAGSIYLMDEGFYSMNRGLWSRNRVGVGMSYAVFKALNVDVTYLQQDDGFNGRTNLVFLQLTTNLP